MMTPKTVASAFAALTQEGTSEEISNWKASAGYSPMDENLHQRVSPLVEKCSVQDVQTIELMMTAHAQSVVFSLLNILDGTDDLENTEDFGMFSLSFESFKTKLVSQIAPNDADTLHDCFMESCMDQFEQNSGEVNQ